MDNRLKNSSSTVSRSSSATEETISIPKSYYEALISEQAQINTNKEENEKIANQIKVLKRHYGSLIIGSNIIVFLVILFMLIGMISYVILFIDVALDKGLTAMFDKSKGLAIIISVLGSAILLWLATTGVKMGHISYEKGKRIK